MYKDYNFKRICFKLIVFAIISLAITSLVRFFPFFSYDSLLYDSFFKLRGTEKAHSNIVLVAIDEKTTKALHHNWPLPLYMHLPVLKKIVSNSPKLISYAMTFNENIGNKQEKDAFSKFVSSNKNSILFASNLPRLDAPEKNPSFINQNETYQNGVAVDRISFAQDGVSRRHVVKLSKIYSLEAAIAKKTGYINSFNNLPETFYTNYVGPANTFTTISFSDIYKNKIPKNFFHDKIVIIRRTTTDTSANFATTPLDKTLYSFTKLEVHANVLYSIISKTYIQKASSLLNFAITFLFLFITLVLTLTTHPATGFFALVASAFSAYILCFASFAYYHIWISAFHPLLVIFMGYYILIPYRLLKETRKRVAMEKDHESLTQVEKFKTNFISLMSHDLKTPIARIHAAAEALARQVPPSHATEHKTSIKSIIESSEDLLHFVNNILNVAKIESQSVSLNIESKDINNIIKGCIKKLDYVARARNIKIEANLEPLFSIKIDAELIRQVISTLLENAIKYSPANSTILLSSSEVNGNYVQIDIKDEGDGISPEHKDLIFTKFYRGNNSRTNPVKGTGLGLYLAKYFVELHKGKIELQSIPTYGSTFSVYLPLNQGEHYV